MSAPVQNPATPHLQAIPGGCQPGTVVHVTGTYTPGAASLIIKLQTGHTGDPTDEIGLCIYGRVREGQLGRNCFTRGGGWGSEELSYGVAGLNPNATFDVAILCDPQCFKIAYNGQHLCEYNHKMNPASLTYLQIGSLPGDLTLSCVWVEQPATSMASAPVYGAPPPAYSSPQSGGNLPYNPNPQSGYAPPPGMQQPPAPYGQPPATYGQQQYPQQGHHNKGLAGMIGGAAAAVGAQGLLNKATNMIGGKSSGYPQQPYPQQPGAYPQQPGAYPQQPGAYPQQGGYPPQGGYYPHKSKGSNGNILKTAAVLAPAAIAVAGPGKALKYGAPLAAAGMLANKGSGSGFSSNKLLKYGAPLAAGYMVTKGVKKGFGGFGGGWSGSDSD